MATLSDGSFCELKYLGDGETELRCAGTGSWKLKSDILTLKLFGEGSAEYPDLPVIKFGVTEDGESFLLTILKDKSEFGHNAKSQIFRISRR